MGLCFPLILAVALLSSLVWCQTVQDAWTAPENPDGTTALNNNTEFTLIWKPNLREIFPQYCKKCNITNLDLWVSNRRTSPYADRIGRGIDITKAASYDWNVNITSDAYSDEDWWQFQFRYADAAYLDPQQVSSPGFHISGLSRTSNSAIASLSSVTPVSSTTVVMSSTSTSTETAAPAETSSPSKSKDWIAGAIVGSLICLLLGLVIVWFCLRKRKNKRAQQQRGYPSYHHGNTDLPTPMNESPKEMYTHTSMPWQHHELGHQDQRVYEAPGDSGPLQGAHRPTACGIEGSRSHLVL
ncbi:hypothetical protein DE146DRAFT_740662 [Phaeosphaeria sp. MPI-PUGE-AT-0046c]|nr:hypothetical protein DE146DRAFT_740662 [Phaeosphaeria sp. MPI-PUGE-AT-0046c]